MVRRAIVTGAEGFVGSFLVSELLDSDYEVWAMASPDSRNGHIAVSSRVHWFSADITRELNLPVKPDVIFNCAGIINDETRMNLVNVYGTRQAAAAALETGARLVHLSSAGVAGDTADNPVTEKSSGRPQNAYEESKRLAENSLSEYETEGLQYQVLRPTIIIGSGRDPGGDSFLQLLRVMRAGRYISMGKAYYNLTPVHEVARVMRLLDREGLPNGGIYIINTPVLFDDLYTILAGQAIEMPRRPHSLPRALMYPAALGLELLQKVSGRKMVFNLSRYRAMTNQKVFSQALLEASLPYIPEHEMSAYILRLFNEYRNQGLI